jgi:separase
VRPSQPELAIPELCELRAGVIAAYERVPVDAHAERSARTRILLFPSPGNVQSTLQPMLLDALALGATCALQLASRASLPAVLSAMREPEGALAWLRAVSEAAERSGVDRTAYAVERAISRALARLSEGEASSFLATATALDARAISLEVLLRVSDVDVDAAWDRAARVAAAHVRGAPEAERNGAFKRADNALRQVLAVTDPLKRRGAGWMRFAEIWMQLARRTGAAEAVERIAALLISSSLAEGPGSKTDAVGQEAADLQLAQSGVALTQAIVALDAAGGERAPAAALNAASGSLAQLGDLGAQASDAGRERFFRAIESLRRRALTSFEKHSTDESLLTLLRSLAKVLCAHLWSGAPASGAVKPAEVLVDAVQVLRVLASSIMDAASSPTHADASALLSQAQALCAIASLDSYERAQQAYFLASSWGALATRLYHARNAGQAVVFLEHGCSASELAESLFAADERDTTEAAEKRQDASTRRLDLLGACLRLASRHQEALDACRRALLSVRAQRWTELDRDAASKGCSTLFQADSPHDKLGHLAAAAHQVAVTHLLIAQSEDEPRSLHAMLAEAKVPAGAMGALLEHCIAALEANAHREEVPLAVQQTTAACLTVYTSARFPLRRARVLLRDLELKLLAGSHEHAALQEIAGEAESLFQVSSLDDDAGLARFRGQYGASLHLLQLLLAQRGPHGSSGQDVAKHAAEAAARFRALLSRAGAGDKASTSSDSSARALQPVAKAPRQGAPPSTPPTRKKLSVGPAGSSASRTASSSAAVQWDDLERVQLLLTVGIEASAAFGHSLATIELLKVLRRLVSTSDAGTSKDLEARICADLARAYLALGRPARAASVLASAPSTEVGPEARFRLLLARAEERCHAGALDIAVLRYEDAIAAARDIDPPAARASSWSKALERAASSERLALAAEAYGSIRFAQGGLAGAVNAAVEAVRCALRGANTVGRLSAPPKSEDSAEDATGGLLEAPAVSDPAHAPSADDVARAATPAAALKPQPRLGSLRLAVMYWRLTRVSCGGAPTCRFADLVPTGCPLGIFESQPHVCCSWQCA